MLTSHVHVHVAGVGRFYSVDNVLAVMIYTCIYSYLYMYSVIGISICLLC